MEKTEETHQKIIDECKEEYTRRIQSDPWMEISVTEEDWKEVSRIQTFKVGEDSECKRCCGMFAYKASKQLENKLDPFEDRKRVVNLSKKEKELRKKVKNNRATHVSRFRKWVYKTCLKKLMEVKKALLDDLTHQIEQNIKNAGTAENQLEALEVGSSVECTIPIESPWESFLWDDTDIGFAEPTKTEKFFHEGPTWDSVSNLGNNFSEVESAPECRYQPINVYYETQVEKGSLTTAFDTLNYSGDFPTIDNAEYHSLDLEARMEESGSLDEWYPDEEYF